MMEIDIHIKLLGGITVKPIFKLSVIIAMALIFSSCSSDVVSQNIKETTESNKQSVQVQGKTI